MIDIVIDARSVDLGGGFHVGRILPFRLRRMVGPFIFLDHAGPVALPASRRRAADVRPHPHIGLSTVSYLFSGAITHRDSLGFEQAIRPGEVNWMTAGRGISHSERFDDAVLLDAHPIELLQAWVALPEQHEETAPAFHNYPQASLPTTAEPGVWLRLIAGDAYGLRSPVATHSPLFYAHAELQPGGRLELPRGHAERGVYVVKGRIEVGGHEYAAKQMLVFSPDEDSTLVAREPSTLALLGGEPVGERFIWWNFVSSRQERIEAAKADWKAGRIPLPPNDNSEFIPLPEEPVAPRPEPIS